MRIDPKVITPITGYKTREQTPSAASPKPSDDSSRASVVKLSTAGVAVTTPATKSAATAKIASIKAAIATGQYPVDLDKLASRIVDDEANRGGSTS
jgi:flagellar biosynthesis anti-sigma factor FlgM